MAWQALEFNRIERESVTTRHWRTKRRFYDQFSFKILFVVGAANSLFEFHQHRNVAAYGENHNRDPDHQQVLAQIWIIQIERVQNIAGLEIPKIIQSIHLFFVQIVHGLGHLEYLNSREEIF